MSLGARVRYYRELRGLTQAELAAKLNTGQTYIADIEKGRRANPKRDTLERIARALEVSMGDLLEDEQGRQAASRTQDILDQLRTLGLDDEGQQELIKYGEWLASRQAIHHLRKKYRSKSPRETDIADTNQQAAGDGADYGIVSEKPEKLTP